MKTAAIISLVLSPAICSAVTLHFSHDFSNATAGAVDGVGDLGTPAAGSFSFMRNGFTPDAPAGAISSGSQAFVLAHRNGASAATHGFTNMSSLPSAASVGGSNPVNFYTISPHRPGTMGTSLRAHLASPAVIAPGQSVNVSFDIGSYGNNNPGQYKIVVVTGVGVSGNALFNLVYQAGSTSQTRELYTSDGFGASSAAYFSVDVTSSNTSSIEGVTRVMDGSSSTFNSTNPAAGPGNLLSVGLEFGFSEQAMLDFYKIALDGNGSTLDLDSNIDDEFALDYLPSGAFMNGNYNQLAALDFTTVWNRSVDSQNKGVWVDNILVTSVPEPSTTLLVMSAALLVFWRRR